MTDDPRLLAQRALLQRAAIVADIAAGNVTLEDINLDPRARLVKVVVLIEVVPGIGKVRSRRALEELGIPPEARWGDLTSVMRRQLLLALQTDGAS
jgi:hypothetical protein